MDKILLSHGSGGLLTKKIIDEIIVEKLKNNILEELNDSAILDVSNKKICFTTDSYVVNPIFFPGGDIGSLAVYGTVNDLSVSGAKPLYLSLSFIIEEGFLMGDFIKIVESISDACKKANVKIVTGDTKVVPKGKGDKIYINTSGIGIYSYSKNLSPKEIAPGDIIILNGSIAEHGLAVLLSRENLDIEADIKSDSQPLNIEIEKILKNSENVRCMRDATRGGVGAILKELAIAGKIDFEIYEDKIPIKPQVKGICEILGLDPLYIANEGKFVIIAHKDEKDTILKHLKNGVAIGYVKSKGEGRVYLKTKIGGVRELDIPSGELIPRIC